jgi:hypothetical protein
MVLGKRATWSTAWPSAGEFQFHIKPLVTGRCVCAACGMDTLKMERAIALPSFLAPEMIIAGLRCRTCEAEQAITLEQRAGAVVLGTSLPRA